jgi:hypothetical protein
MRGEVRLPERYRRDSGKRNKCEEERELVKAPRSFDRRRERRTTEIDDDVFEVASGEGDTGTKPSRLAARRELSEEVTRRLRGNLGGDLSVGFKQPYVRRAW